MPKCLNCNVELIEDDTYNSSIDENFAMTASFNKIGHCPKCEKEYQWDVCYDLENPLVQHLGEV